MGHLESQETHWVEIFNEIRFIFSVKSFTFKWQLSIYDIIKMSQNTLSEWNGCEIGGYNDQFQAGCVV